MTTREFYIMGMMLKAYRQICKISTEHFAQKAHVSKSTIAKLEGFASNSLTDLCENSYIAINYITCKRIAVGMDILFSEFMMMVETLSKEKDELLDVIIYIEIAKILLNKRSMTMGE